MQVIRRLRPSHGLLVAAVALTLFVLPSGALAAKTRVRAHASTSQSSPAPNPYGELDCNGDSPVQHSVRLTMNCTDVRGFDTIDNSNTWGARFYDNGSYIGHDEPDMGFYSSRAGSGNNVTWSETLPLDPSAAPTVKSPGSDVVHWFELTPAPWYSMMMCDPNSYPGNPCTPESDANAPTCVGAQTTNCYPGGGNAFMEMQFYPPGFPPFVDSTSCDDSHWCAALTIDSLECTLGFATCNTNCEEPVNFAYIQTNGVPAGPASPQESDLATFTPDVHTLLMNPGDKITVHMFNAPVPGGGGAHAFEVVVDDLTTGQSGFMQASAANGFQNTSMADCSGTPFNFQPEYNTASQANVSPWAALQTNVSTEYEIGHFEPCTNVTSPFSVPVSATVTDTSWSNCHGPYETAGGNGDGAKRAEVSDAFCYPAGDTHGALDTQPDTVSGCTTNYAQNGDLDFDGTPYWADWPTSAKPTATFAGSFSENLPKTGGSSYSQYMIQTDTALSETTCQSDGTGCAIPAPGSPGGFYPFWSRVGSGANCTLEFGNVTSGAGVNDLGADAQYGSDQQPTLGYPEFEGPIQANTCT